MGNFETPRCKLPLFELQVTGEHVIVDKNISSFAEGHSPHLSTLLLPQHYRLKVAVLSSGPSLTQRSETTKLVGIFPKLMSDIRIKEKQVIQDRCIL